MCNIYLNLFGVSSQSVIVFDSLCTHYSSDGTGRMTICTVIMLLFIDLALQAEWL